MRRSSGQWAVGGRQWAAKPKAWSRDLAVLKPAEALPWMLELANALRLFTHELPTGMIVGSAVIERVEAGDDSTGGLWRWHLTDVKALSKPRLPRGGHPQPVWRRETRRLT
ncbi:MAG: hypothetical protein QM770_08420 [Tepidisphaeraceae bacterium]